VPAPHEEPGIGAGRPTAFPDSIGLMFQTHKMKPLRKLLNRQPTAGQAALNPPASDAGLDEPISPPATSAANGIIRAVCFVHAFAPSAPAAGLSQLRRHGFPSGTALPEAG
jgi:hypothetical protein